MLIVGVIVALSVIGSACDTEKEKPVAPAVQEQSKDTSPKEETKVELTPEQKARLAETEKKNTETNNPIVVDIQKFIKEFDGNQLASEEKYKDKIIETSGVIGNISEDIMGKPFIVLKPANDKYYFGTEIQCYFTAKEALYGLTNGQLVRIRGRMDTQVMNILIKDCEIVK